MAYADNALPIGESQTMSQPYMVALMTELLGLNGTERVLEIGTGSGYQAAVLAELAAKVYTVERVKALADKARMVLDRLGYRSVAIKVYDGTYGWKEMSPFDAIMVTAGAPEVPAPLVEQLRIGGKNGYTGRRPFRSAACQGGQDVRRTGYGSKHSLRVRASYRSLWVEGIAIPDPSASVIFPACFVFPRQSCS